MRRIDVSPFCLGVLIGALLLFQGTARAAAPSPAYCEDCAREYAAHAAGPCVAQRAARLAAP